MSTPEIIAVGRSLGLTPRESAVVAMVHADEPDKSIACGMQVSPHTVRSHLRSIFGKLHVQTRVACALTWERASVRHSRFVLAGSGDMQANHKRLK